MPRNTRGNARVILLVLIAVIVAAFFMLGGAELLSLESLRNARESLESYVTANFAAAALAFFGIYVVVAAFSLPGAAIMTLAAGALFGFGWGFVLVSFASSIGATLALLMSRLLLRDWVESKFQNQFESINRGLRNDGAFYLFGLRMVPLFPFFVINLVMGVTQIGVGQFYWISQLGMLAGTAVYVYAGTQLATVSSLADIASPTLLIAFALLGLFPLIAKKLLEYIKTTRAGSAQ